MTDIPIEYDNNSGTDTKYVNWRNEDEMVALRGYSEHTVMTRLKAPEPVAFPHLSRVSARVRRVERPALP